MALLLLLWLHMILNKSTLSIKHAANLRGLTRQNQRLPVRLHHRIKTHINHDGKVKDEGWIFFAYRSLSQQLQTGITPCRLKLGLPCIQQEYLPRDSTTAAPWRARSNLN
jgi:hypothetical protein